MWTRAELKDRAKFAFKRNYWRSVLISLLLALLIGGGSGAGSAGSAMSSALGSDGSDITSDSYDDFYDDADDIWYGIIWYSYDFTMPGIIKSIDHKTVYRSRKNIVFAIFL